MLQGAEGQGFSNEIKVPSTCTMTSLLSSLKPTRDWGSQGTFSSGSFDMQSGARTTDYPIIPFMCCCNFLLQIHI